MATITLNYKGTCDGGPWRGQSIAAKRGFIELPDGLYRWWRGVWQWKPQQTPGA